MCGSDLNNGGGVVAVTQNYLNYDNWEDITIRYLSTHIYGNATTKIIYFIKSYLKILALFRKKSVDIVHLHTCDGGPFFRKGIILLTAKYFGVKTILHHHTDYEPFFNNAKGLKRRFMINVINKADVNIVLGECLKEQIIQFAGNVNTIVIRNGIKTQESNQYNNDGFGILFLGWFQEIKGFFDFLNAFNKIKDSIDGRFKLILCGGANEEEQRLIDAFGLKDRIYYMGWADKAKKEELFKNVLVNVLPSYNEGLPMSIIETMAYGIPNIGSNITTIPEIIVNNQTGYIVEAGNIDGIAEKLETILQNPEIRNRFSRQSFERVGKEFSLHKQIQTTKKLYYKIMEVKSK